MTHKYSAHANRRTFAIIAHPDAGKTTLTEHLLLESGAIHLAGQVRARGQRRRTRSDWMKIERERGISVTASVMTFTHGETLFNLLDTPGHEDFSEDTYRALSAADSAVMVLDAARGIEPQTLKLFEVCRLRNIPICTFINKMDREAQDPFALIDEIANTLALDPAPLYWPQDSGARFAGMHCLRRHEFIPFNEGKPDAQLQESVDMVKELCPAFDAEAFRTGHMTPIIFGAAVKGFGVKELRSALAELAPPPIARKAQIDGADVHIQPGQEETSGFVFRIQANMDPKHRDRIAFVRLCSGQFTRGDRLKTAEGKALAIHTPVLFMAQDRQIAETACAGDIIGVPGKGALKVGDSVSQSGRIRFAGVPSFAPEILRRARALDPMKTKHLRRALEGLAEEGVTQLFRPLLGADLIVGGVGQLQIDVMAERVRGENGLEMALEECHFATARWLSASDDSVLQAFIAANRAAMCIDMDDGPVFMAKSLWEANYAAEKNPEIRFLVSKDRGLIGA